LCGLRSFAQVGDVARVWSSLVAGRWTEPGTGGWIRAGPDRSTTRPGCPQRCPQACADLYPGSVDAAARSNRPSEWPGPPCVSHVGNLGNPRGQGCGLVVDRLWAGCGPIRR